MAARPFSGAAFIVGRCQKESEGRSEMFGVGLHPSVLRFVSLVVTI